MSKIKQNKINTKKLNFRLETIKYLIESNLLNLDFIFNFDNKNKSNLQILDPLIFIKNLKQIVRTLQFLKNSKNYFLCIDTFDNDFFFTAVSLLLIKRKKEKINSLFINEKKNKFKISNKKHFEKKRSCLYLYFNNNSFTAEWLKSLFFKNFFMIYTINTNKDINHLGYYKFYGNLNEIKKIIFFSTLLKKYL